MSKMWSKYANKCQNNQAERSEFAEINSREMSKIAIHENEFLRIVRYIMFLFYIKQKEYNNKQKCDFMFTTIGQSES